MARDINAGASNLEKDLYELSGRIFTLDHFHISRLHRLKVAIKTS